MRNERRRRPRLEALEGLTLLSGIAATMHALESPPLNGTVHGTFFAHRSNPSSGTIYDLFASGKVGGVGPTLVVSGIQTEGFKAHGAGGGNLIFEAEAASGSLFLGLTEVSRPTATSPGPYVFHYTIKHGTDSFKGAHGSGTLTVTLKPVKDNIHGQPVSNPGFFGNSTLTFSPSQS